MATDPKSLELPLHFEKKGERSPSPRRPYRRFRLPPPRRVLPRRRRGVSRPFAAVRRSRSGWLGRVCPLSAGARVFGGSALRAKAATRNQDGDEPFGLPKLAETVVVLESSRMMGSGNRTPLHFARGCVVRHTPQDPGNRWRPATTLSCSPETRIVLCRGVNAGAYKFSVSEICFPPPLPLAVHTAGEALDHGYSAGKLAGNALNIVAASGPYTPTRIWSSKVAYRMMDELEAGGLPHDTGSTERRGVPDTLILTGPFISSRHPLLPFLTELLTRCLHDTSPNASHNSWPSSRYQRGTHPVDAGYTQPTLRVPPTFLLQRRIILPKGVRCLPNPSVFYVNELVVGVTAEDALGDIKGEEMVTRIESSATPTP